jgi:hypothetical protein
MADRQVSAGEEKPLRGKLSTEAFAAGEKARSAGKVVEDCPAHYQSALARAWRAGWTAADIRTRPAEFSHAPSPMVSTRVPHPLERWPDGKPLPTAYTRPPMPCQGCRRVLDDSGGRCVRVRATWQDIVYLRCVCCSHEWKLPIDRS